MHHPMTRERASADLDRRAANCRWASPTMMLPAPFWFEADDYAWACLQQGRWRLLETTEACLTCVQWEPRLT